MRIRERYKAVGFDMDGTLLDTRVDYQRMTEIVLDEMERIGVPDNAIDRSGGYKFNIDSGVEWLRSNGRGSDIFEINRRVSRAARDVEMEHVDKAVPFPGAVELIRALRSQDIRVGVLTRGCREYADGALSVSGVIDLLDHVVARDDHPEEEAKPSPVAMEHLAHGLGVSPEDILFVGDHSFDMICAKESGAGFVGVLSGTYGRGDWEKIGETRIIDTVADLIEFL
ncbi:MAG: HAD family hydrolase [Candidatus Methanomethylophilaceae archaeon]|nr:HAD family hydrolase [Candidatus Methanomethylophilaceae archaeon]